MTRTDEFANHIANIRSFDMAMWDRIDLILDKMRERPAIWSEVRNRIGQSPDTAAEEILEERREAESARQADLFEDFNWVGSRHHY